MLVAVTLFECTGTAIAAIGIVALHVGRLHDKRANAELAVDIEAPQRVVMITEMLSESVELAVGLAWGIMVPRS